MHDCINTVFHSFHVDFSATYTCRMVIFSDSLTETYSAPWWSPEVLHPPTPHPSACGDGWRVTGDGWLACMRQPGCKAARPGIWDAVLTGHPTNTHIHSTALDREEERDWRGASRGTGKGKVRTGGRKDRLEGGWSAACTIKERLPGERETKAEGKKETSQSQILLRRMLRASQKLQKTGDDRQRVTPILSEENTAMHFHFGVSTGSDFQGEVQDQIHTLRDERICGSSRTSITWGHQDFSWFLLC